MLKSPYVKVVHFRCQTTDGVVVFNRRLVLVSVV